MNYIPVFALLVSFGVLVIQYRIHINNQKERIADLQSSLLSRLISIKQRIDFYLINVNSIRILLRTTADSEDKYESIELMPELVKQIEELKQMLENLVKSMNDVKIKDTKVKVAIEVFQKLKLRIIALEDLVQGIEDKILGLLENVKESQKKNETSNTDT
jgi:DNA repair exonuclease SbcCD ATPase subunit